MHEDEEEEEEQEKEKDGDFFITFFAQKIKIQSLCFEFLILSFWGVSSIDKNGNVGVLGIEFCWI